MADDQQRDHRSLSPRLQIRSRSEKTISSTVHHPTTPDSSKDASAVAKEKLAESNAFDGANKTIETFLAKVKQFWRPENLPPALQWIPANWTWSKWKPVLRSALAAWICLLLFLIPKTLSMMGQAAFLIIIASFLSPPSDPFIAVLQRELGILVFAALGWAWSCLGIKLAYLARSHKDPTAPFPSIITGQYLEAGPTVIMAIFLFTGSAFFLYFKSRLGPGPLTIACIFGCIGVDISMTTAVFFPFPYYKIGQFIVLPLTFHSAVALIISLCVFPTSESATFTTRLQEVLSSLVSAIREHNRHIQEDVTAPDFSASSIVAAVGKAEGALGLLAATARLQRLDVVYSRFAPTDYAQLHDLTRGVIVKACGMGLYYTLIDPTRERFPVTPAPSIPETPTLLSPSHSRPPSPGHNQPLADTEKVDNHPSLDGKPKKHHPHPNPHHHHHYHRKRLHSPHGHHATHSHSSLRHFSLFRHARTEQAVGVFESLNYLNLEATHLSHPDSEMHVARANELLSNSSLDLLKSCERGLQGVCDWLGFVGDNRLTFWVGREDGQQIRMDRIKKYEDLHRELSSSLEEFTNKKRFIVIGPYRPMVSSEDDALTEREITPHRHLFHCYVYQYHLMRFSTSVQDMLSEILRLETLRESPRVWFPRIIFAKLIHTATWEPSEMVERDDDENPDLIPGLDPTSLPDLGEAVRRDPDALPPRNVVEKTANWIYDTAKGIGGGNALFAVKAGILSILLSLPSFLESSAEFAYKNKAVWAVIMGQLTLSRFRGDTTFGLVTRIISTFVGGIIGTVMWYISTGSGKGNAFGLAAVCFVCYPFFFFFRLYWPVSPMTNLIIWVTTALTFGYSYQDTHLATPASPGYGIDVAWRRFVLVVIGVMAAGIFSFLPPSTTIRLYQRKSLATVTTEIGSTYCSLISFAHTKEDGETAVIVQHLLAILSKLKRSIVLKQNVVYEFSLRGKWPAERYQRILDLQIQISNLLSQLTSVLEQMEPAWAHAFLRRTRLSDANFQGDVLAVMSLISSSLRNGNPLPQVTPCPLLHRFLERSHASGLNVVHEESEEDFSLPKVLTEETLESLQYMIFCVGVSTAFGIVTRLDKLMVAVKELVGEQFHIHGVGLPLYHRGRPPPEIRSPVSTHDA